MDQKWQEKLWEGYLKDRTFKKILQRLMKQKKKNFPTKLQDAATQTEGERDGEVREREGRNEPMDMKEGNKKDGKNEKEQEKNDIDRRNDVEGELVEVYSTEPGVGNEETRRGDGELENDEARIVDQRNDAAVQEFDERVNTVHRNGGELDVPEKAEARTEVKKNTEARTEADETDSELTELVEFLDKVSK